jgi:hypothetical protein
MLKACLNVRHGQGIHVIFPGACPGEMTIGARKGKVIINLDSDVD